MNPRAFVTLVTTSGALFLSGCATPLGSVTTLPPLPKSVKFGAGEKIEVRTPDTASAISLQPSSGRGSAADGAFNGIRALGNGGRTSAEGGIVLFALLPVAAVVGAAVETSRVASPETRTKADAEARVGLLRVANQDAFREAFLAVAEQRTDRNFVPAASSTTSRRSDAPESPVRMETRAEWILELGLTSVRLERTVVSDASYALFIDAQVRLIRAADGATVYAAPIRYQSGMAAFADWAFDHGRPVRRAAEFGERQLAEQIMEKLFSSSS